MIRRTAAGLVAALVLLVGPAPSVAAAQDPSGVTIQDPVIIPEPNSGVAPEDPGDRGGALQLLVLGAVVVTVGGAIAHLVRQSRRARSET